MRRSKLGKWGALLLSMLLAAQLMAGIAAAAPQEAPSVADAAADAGDWLASGPDGQIGDWTAFALARAGVSIPDGYVKTVEESVKQAGARTLVTDYERWTLAVQAAGGDPTNVGGVNLVERIYSYDDIGKTGTMGPIYGLLALDSGDYAIPADAKWTKAKLVEWVTGHQLSDGGWSYAAEGAGSSIDVTAMALTALAPHKAEENAKQAIERGLAWLKTQQKDNGGFDEMGQNSESAAQVIIALATLGQDPKGEAFRKAGGDPIDFLLGFRQADGGFAHAKADAKSDGIATEQALLALTALQLQAKGEGGLYNGILPNRAVDIRVEGPQGPIAKGSVEAPHTLAGLEKLLAAKNIPVEVKPSDWGKYVTSVNGIAASGMNGWLFNVKRGGQWQHPQVGMDQYKLAAGDQAVVYYGGATQVVKTIAVSPEQPKAGRAFTVTVTQEKWDWEAGKTVQTPAAGVTVKIGTQTQKADEHGAAAFGKGLPQGAYTIEVTGYQTDAAPTVVPESAPLKVASADVYASIRVEGPHAPIAEGNVKAANVIDALKTLLDAKGLKFEVKHYDFGDMVTSIDGNAAGAADGWMFVVKRGGDLVFPQVGMQDFELQAGDRIVVYIGAWGVTQPVGSVEWSPAQPKVNESFTVKVTTVGTDEKGAKVSSPAAGVTVEVAGQKQTTNAKGEAAFSGLPYGSYRAVVSGYQQSGAPAIVRETKPLLLFADLDQATDWAVPFVDKSIRYGLLEGDGPSYEPVRPVTRAEFAAILVRQLGGTPVKPAVPDFGDVPVDSWFAPFVSLAKELGIVEGMDAETFAPDQTITREQMALMLTRAYGLKPAEDAVLHDGDAASAEAVPAIRAVISSGLMVGEAGWFDPQGIVTREMAATVAVRAYEKAAN